jgi:hypothetical protein
MSRLYWRHEPTDIQVLPAKWRSLKNEGTAGEEEYWAFHTDNQEGFRDTPEFWNYVCFVFDGAVWAARKASHYSSGTRVMFMAVKQPEDCITKAILLKDLLLG